MQRGLDPDALHGRIVFNNLRTKLFASPPNLTTLGPFQIQSHLGSGGMGSVYCALDTRSREQVALKILRGPAGRLTERARREFSDIADISHRNLVQLYEMHVERGLVFFSMELLAGVDIVRYVCRKLSSRHANPIEVEVSCAVLSQVAQALGYLHRLGRVHGDVKPSNILVENGRAVLIDFGLSMRIGHDGSEPSELGGTRAYMSNARRLGASPCAASDWYAFGVVLQQCLVEFGTDIAAVTNPALRSLIHDAARICREILGVRPLETTSGTAISKLFAHESASGGKEIVRPSRFIGRRDELNQLWSVVTRETAQPTMVGVLGTAGIGKTALIEEFISQDFDGDCPPLVLRGRCHDREYGGVHALEDLVLGIVRYVDGLPAELARTLISASSVHAARMFPALDRLDAVRAYMGLSSELDPTEARVRRQLACEGLFDISSSIAEYRRIVIWIDDLQWCDGDSLELLRGLFAHRGGLPGCVGIFCSRSELPIFGHHQVVERKRLGCGDVQLAIEGHRACEHRFEAFYLRGHANGSERRTRLLCDGAPHESADEDDQTVKVLPALLARRFEIGLNQRTLGSQGMTGVLASILTNTLGKAGRGCTAFHRVPAEHAPSVAARPGSTIPSSV